MMKWGVKELKKPKEGTKIEKNIQQFGKQF